MIKSALQPLTHLFGAAVAMRGWLYDRGILKSVKVAVPVVSVGNLTMGGTGKTAVVLELLKWSESQGLKVGVISRGYKRQTTGVERVTSSDAAAQLFGDEPAMIALRFPNVPVYVAAQRSEAANALLAAEKVDFLIADDAFQHRALRRDLDIVLLDATENLENYRLLPRGRARESLTALTRAQFVIATKTNLVSSDKKNAVSKLIEQYQTGAGFKIVECKFMASRWVPLKGGEPREIKQTDRVFLVSGIGNPEAFRNTISAMAKVVGHSRFADHHEYTEQNFDDVKEEFEAAKGDYILTTEKDAVKFRRFAHLHGKVRVALLEPQFSGEIQSLYDAITRLVR